MKRKPLKIIGFDSWTKGAHHFERLVPAFNDNDMSLMLVHLGSWGNDPGRPPREQIGGLMVKDIASYGYGAIDKVLKEEKPDAVIFLSTETFAHRAFNRFCMQRRIPTLLLYHGLVAVQVINDTRGSYRIDRLSYLRFVLSKLFKTFCHTLPCYISALMSTKASWPEWRRFLSDLIYLGLGGKRHLVVARDARTTRCCVYTEPDIDHAVLDLGFSKDDVVAVGNPDLVRFGLKQEMIGSCMVSSGSHNREVMYIDTALTATGLIFKSKMEFIDHLKQTADSLTEQGIKMLFKPHPAHDAGFLAEQLKGLNIEFVANEKFLQRLEGCIACMVETTTLAMVPALMGLPLLYTNYGTLKELRFGPVLTSYPRGHMLQDLDNVSLLLRKDAERLDVEAVKNWITANAGPLPAEAMPKRVADVVQTMVVGCGSMTPGINDEIEKTR